MSVVDLASRKKHTRKICVYFLRNENKSYIGFTVNLRRRLKQHKGILPGGAKCTSAWPDHSKTELLAFIGGFETQNEALSYEWHAKRRNCPPHMRFDTDPKTHPRFCRFFEPMLNPKFGYLDKKLTIYLVRHHELSKTLKENYPIKEVVLVTEP